MSQNNNYDNEKKVSQWSGEEFTKFSAKKSTAKLFGQMRQFKYRNAISRNSSIRAFRDIAKSGGHDLGNAIQYTRLLKGASGAIEALNLGQAARDSVETYKAFGWQAAFQRDVGPYLGVLGASAVADSIGGPVAGGATAIAANTFAEIHKRKLDNELTAKAIEASLYKNVKGYKGFQARQLQLKNITKTQGIRIKPITRTSIPTPPRNPVSSVPKSTFRRQQPLSQRRVSSGLSSTQKLARLSVGLGAIGATAAAGSGRVNYSNEISKVEYGHYDPVSGKLLKFHSGGVVPGRGEIMALLMGGETVRTEEQERAIQEVLLRKHSDSSENTSQKNSKNSLQPKLSKEDDQYVIGLIADAYKRNRYGFRTVLRS